MTIAIQARRLVFSRSDWESRLARHQGRVRERVEDWLERSARGVKHPVWDFLFTYYSFPPRKLMTWVPRLGVADDEPKMRDASESASGTVEYSWPPLRSRDVELAEWVTTLCSNILAKPARFSCHGWHEWAMVYKQSAADVRHNGYTLRLSPEALAEVVEAHLLCCSHYDAYRFFTPEALPRNSLHPRLESRLEMEQGGCLHTNMDLYKWAYKLWPWIGSELVADAFEVAVSGRILDMRASPYDLRDLGFDPIPMETEAGREHYRLEQQRLAEAAALVRAKLMAGCQELVGCRHF